MLTHLLLVHSEIGSAYTIATISTFDPADPYEFKTYEIGADNLLITHYYQITQKDGITKSLRIDNPSGTTLPDINNTHFVGLFKNITDPSISAEGGAIYNIGIIGNINADFLDNYAQISDGTARGGVIYSNAGAKIGNIKGDFINNYAKSADGYAIWWSY